MTFVYMQEFKIGDRSTSNYDFMKEKIGDEQIEGLIVHTAGFDDDSGVWRMLDVWESKEQADRFMGAGDDPGSPRGAAQAGHCSRGAGARGAV